MLISEFEWDDDNIEHLGYHGVDPEDVEAILGSRITVRRNKRAGSGTYRFEGRSRGGRRLVVIVVKAGAAGRWRPVTALWRS